MIDFDSLRYLIGDVEVDVENEENCIESEEQFLLEPDDTNTKYVYVNTRIDYQYRSSSLENICLYDYIRFYRKKPIDAKDRKYLKIQSAPKNLQVEDVRRGRPPSEREIFLSVHPQASSHINVKRGVPVVPVLLGPPIPRRDREDTKERYCRSVLTLFTPWRSVTDLCNPGQRWEEALETRRLRITPESQKTIDNIQLLQECKNDRDEHLQQVIEATQTEIVDDRVTMSHHTDFSDDENDEVLDMLEAIDIEGIPAMRNLGNKSEQAYFEATVSAVNQANRFPSIKGRCQWTRDKFSFITSCTGFHSGSINRLIDSVVSDKHTNHGRKYLVPATVELILSNNQWQRRIREEKEQKRKAFMMIGMENEYAEQTDKIENQVDMDVDNVLSSVRPNDEESLNFKHILSVAKVTVPVEYTKEHIAEKFTLNQNQKAAYMIITGHLDGLDKLNEGIRIELMI